MKPEYVSLHTHTHNSLLDGYSKNNEYIDHAVELGHRGLGISDHGNLRGVYSFINEARSKGITPVPGVEFYVAPINPEGARVQEPVFYGNNSRFDVSARGAYLHLTVWAYNNVGLHNLFKLSTKSYAVENFYKAPRIDFDMLVEHNEGLIVSTGCPSSEISTRFLLGQKDKAYAYASRLKDVFGDRLYVEIMDHDMPISLERDLLPLQLQLSKDLNIPLLATNDTHYSHAKDAKAHEEMLCVQSGAFMDDETYDNGGGRFAFSGQEYYLKTAEQMAAIFPDDTFPNALKNSLLITEMASDITLDYNPNLKPEPKVPSQFESKVTYYKYLLNVGFKERYSEASPEVKAEAKKRIKYEYDVIFSSDFIGYMLVVTDYLRYSREKYSIRNSAGDIIVSSNGPGRGSVGGSIHAFLLGISDVDPIKHDLVFERFLSPGRGATYRLTYDNGETEDIIVSDLKKIVSEDGQANKYIHELNVGDVVIEGEEK